MTFYDYDANQPGATTRKGAAHVDRQSSGISYYSDDEDGTQKKYNRRGELRFKQMLVDSKHFSYLLTNLVAGFIGHKISCIAFSHLLVLIFAFLFYGVFLTTWVRFFFSLVMVQSVFSFVSLLAFLYACFLMDLLYFINRTCF